MKGGGAGLTASTTGSPTRRRGGLLLVLAGVELVVFQRWYPAGAGGAWLCR